MPKPQPDAGSPGTLPSPEVVEACRKGLALLPQYQPGVTAAVKKRAEKIVAGHRLSKNMLGRLRTYHEGIVTHVPLEVAGTEQVPNLLAGGLAAKAWLWPPAEVGEPPENPAPKPKPKPSAAVKTPLPTEKKAAALRSPSSPGDAKEARNLTREKTKKSDSRHVVEKRKKPILRKASAYENALHRHKNIGRGTKSAETQSILRNFIKPPPH